MPRVYDRDGWITIENTDNEEDEPKPMKPVLDEDNGRIFVSIPSYRGM